MQVAESLPQKPAWRAGPFAALSLAIVIMLASIAVLDLTGGPISDTSGVVQEMTKGPDGFATVVLANGTRVKAAIGRGFNPRAGDEVEVVIREKTMTGPRSYVVVGPKEMHNK